MKVAVRKSEPEAAARSSIGTKTALRRTPARVESERLLELAPISQPFEEASACLHRLGTMPDQFHLNSLLAQVLFVQLHRHTETQFDASHEIQRPLQTGRGWRSFSKLFDPLTAIELVRLFENLLRFASYDAYAPARAFFLAYAPLSFEHDAGGEFIGPGVWTPEAGSRTAALRVRRTLRRWCDWLEALVHFQVHQSHRGTSPNLKLDKVLILLWPLLKRHQWSYGDLLKLVRSTAHAGCACCQSEELLAAYCRNFLGLRNPRSAGAAQAGVLPGKPVADRLLNFLPMIG